MTKPVSFLPTEAVISIVADAVKTKAIEGIKSVRDKAFGSEAPRPKGRGF